VRPAERKLHGAPATPVATHPTLKGGRADFYCHAGSCLRQIDGTFTALPFVSHAALIGSNVYETLVPVANAAKP
jgi:hypothetical protein